MTEAEWILRMWKYIDESPQSKLLIGKERRLWDNSRVDILTSQYAIEVDWAYKWKEAIGQSLWYSVVTTKAPGICLLLKNIADDSMDIHRCNTICVKYDIALWLVDTSSATAIMPDGERVRI